VCQGSEYCAFSGWHRDTLRHDRGAVPLIKAAPACTLISRTNSGYVANFGSSAGAQQCLLILFYEKFEWRLLLDHALIHSRVDRVDEICLLLVE